jgi:hypothetical protein
LGNLLQVKLLFDPHFLKNTGNICIVDLSFDNRNDIIPFKLSMIEDKNFVTIKLKVVMYDFFEGVYHRNLES